MAFINHDKAGKCPTHGCELTGFVTLFCPRCEEEKQSGGPSQKATSKVFYLFTEVFATPKRELALLQGHNLYYSVERLKEDIDLSRAYNARHNAMGVPGLRRISKKVSIWAVEKDQFKEGQLRDTPNIFAIHRTATTLVGVAAELVEDY